MNERNEAGEGNFISLTSQNQDFPVPKFSISTSDGALLPGGRKKKNTVFHQFPRLWELTKFLADFRKSFLDAKINVWLHYALGGEPAEFSHRGWEGLVLS